MFARIYVEIDMSEDLPECLIVNVEDLEVEVSIVFEKLPDYCLFSNSVWHTLKNYRNRSSTASKKIGFGQGKKPQQVYQAKMPNAPVSKQYKHVQVKVCSASVSNAATESIAAKFLDKIVKWTKNMKISDPFEEGCRIGPIVSKRQYDKVLKFVSNAKSEGATILCRAARPQHLEKGFFVEPAIIIW